MKLIPTLAPTFLQLRTERINNSQEWNQNAGDWCFLFPRQGGGSHVSSLGRHPLAVGDVFVVNLTKGRLAVPPAGELEFSTFSLRLDHLIPLLDSGEMCRLSALVDGLQGVKLFPADTPLARECHRLLTGTPADGSLDHRTHLLRVAATILTHEFARVRPEGGGSRPPKEHRLHVLEKLATEDLLKLSVSELAVKLGCCRRHLNRLYRQHFGVSLSSLKMEMRLLKAASLLRNHDSKVAQVAEECGFNQMGRFNSCFKRRFGDTPGRWRRQSAPGDGGQSGPDVFSAARPTRVRAMPPVAASFPNPQGNAAGLWLTREISGEPTPLPSGPAAATAEMNGGLIAE